MMTQAEGEAGGRGVGDITYIKMKFMIMPTIFSWNVRGLRREVKRWGVRDLLKREKFEVITLQETKVQNIDRKFSTDLWGRREFGFVHKPAIGSARDILVA